MPDWRGSTRKESLPPDWETAIRPRILKRDRYQCQHVRYDTERKCGAFANQVDHIGDRNDHRDSNLQSLCQHHHQLKSSSQGGTAAATRRQAAKKRRHPGLLP